MDETPEELARIREEAAKIDPYKYRKRTRALAGIAVGAALAGATWGALELTDQARNPCERVRDYFCARSDDKTACVTYGELTKDSIEEKSGEMRSNIRAQCQIKIDRLRADEGVVIP